MHFCVMKPILWTLLLGLPLSLAAQNTYYKTVGNSDSDFGTSCIPTADMGSLLSVCGGMSGGMGVQFALVKTDHNGTKQWDKVFRNDSFAYAQTVVPATDGGYAVLGSVSHPTEGYQALFMLKTDAQGNEEWSYRLPASLNDRPVGLLACKAGGYLSCSVANYNSVNGQYPQALLIRYDEAGTILWARQYAGPYGVEPQAVTELPDGDIAFVSTAKFSLADPFAHTLVTRTDAQGNPKWNRFFAMEFGEEPHDITANAKGELYVTGATYRMGYEWDGFLLKLDTDGQRVFSTLYDAGSLQGEMFRCVTLTPQGSVLLLGDMGTFNERDINLMSLNDEGQMQWVKRYPFSPMFVNYALDMYTSYNGGIVFTGDVRPPAALRDAALVRTDSLGNLPCYNETAVYTRFDVPFAQSPQTLSVSEPVMPAPDSITFTHPLPPIIEKPGCENPLPVVLNKWAPASMCPQVCMDFTDSTLNHPTDWVWTFEGAEPSVSTQQHPKNVCYKEAGTYSVSLTATNAQGTVTQYKKIVIHDTQCPPPIIPNIFTPNGDGLNDEFLIGQLPDEFVFRIYNRWGEEVFLSSEKEKLWKGKNKLGLPVTDGVYFYRLETDDEDYHGFIHVSR